MATLVLGAVGSAVGGAIFPGSVLGTAITGATIGGALGSIAGSLVDQGVAGAARWRSSGEATTHLPEGPAPVRCKQLGASSEGAPLPRLYGRARLAGQLIWATRFKEEVTVTTQTTGGGQVRGGGKNLCSAPAGRSARATAPTQTVKTIEYSYFANAAYAICEGPITRVGRIWADGKELANSPTSPSACYRGSENTRALTG